MQNVSGTILGLDSKEVSTRSGKTATVHYIRVEGFPERISVGWKQPYSSGAYFSGTVEKSYGEFKVTTGSVGGTNTTVADNKSQVTTPAASMTRHGFAGRSEAPFPVPELHPENRIMRQNALQHAARIVSSQILQGEYKDTNNEDIADVVLELAVKFVDWSTGRAEERAVQEMEQQGNVDADAA